jgi:hypothetical protein
MRSARWPALAALALSACVTSQSRFVRLEAPQPPLPAEAPVSVFEAGVPDRPFVRVARLDVHLERSFASFTVADAMPELLRQARLAGADGIIELQERRDAVAEAKVLHVTATGIRFLDAAAKP